MPAPLPAVPPGADVQPPLAPPTVPEPTPTGYALLGLLSFGQELSGYELKHLADSSLRFFWSAPAMSQVYRELERLAEGGYVEQRSVVREGSRATKVYRLAPAGEEAVRRWLVELPDPPLLKHPVALRVFFGHLLSREELCTAIEAHRRWCEEMLAELAAVRDGLGDDPVWRNAALVAEWGLGYYRGEVDAMDGLADASRRARPADPDGGARLDGAPA
jgi:DNA-binding PadR family transcriptional regulator